MHLLNLRHSKLNIEGLVDGKAALTAALAGETVQISVEPWEEKIGIPLIHLKMIYQLKFSLLACLKVCKSIFPHQA